MAMPEIHLDIDRLLNDVISMNDAKLKDIDTAMVSSCNAVATLTVMGWEGKAKEAFMNKFNEFKKEMKAFNENLNAFNHCLKQIQANGEIVYSQGSVLTNGL